MSAGLAGVTGFSNGTIPNDRRSDGDPIMENLPVSSGIAVSNEARVSAGVTGVPGFSNGTIPKDRRSDGDSKVENMPAAKSSLGATGRGRVSLRDSNTARAATASLFLPASPCVDPMVTADDAEESRKSGAVTLASPDLGDSFVSVSAFCCGDACNPETRVFKGLGPDDTTTGFRDISNVSVFERGVRSCSSCRPPSATASSGLESSSGRRPLLPTDVVGEPCTLPPHS